MVCVYLKLIRFLLFPEQTKWPLLIHLGEQRIGCRSIDEQFSTSNIMQEYKSHKHVTE